VNLLRRIPSVTIGLPLHSGLEYAEQAVRSIFAQTMTDWELVVVCDGADRFLVERMHAIKDARVRVISHHENRGLAVRLNEITSAARSELVARMDSDDLMHPTRISRQMVAMEESPDVDVLGSGSYLMDEANTVCGRYREPSLPSSTSGFLTSGVFSHPTVIFRRQWAKRNPYDPLRIRTEDKDLWLRAAPHSTFGKLDESLLYCRVPRSLSVEKQSITAIYDRKLILELGPSVAPRRIVYRKVLESHLKQRIFSTLAMFGSIGRIHKTKYVQLSLEELSGAQSVVESILCTEVPGWD
jgi:glycosyltransferase involved in cell wall biosynthesis